tara:strand:+ start:179 stop:742 length:564 start_codon:yes stop_codon:yes gene_type:complete
MADLNQVILEGRLTDDPEFKTVGDNKSLCNFSVATSHKFGDREITEYHRCVAWSYTAEACSVLSKGTPVIVRGRLQTRSWDDKTDGKKRYKTEVVADSVFASPSAEKKTPVSRVAPTIWPYFDSNTAVRWPEPVKDGTSYTELDSGRQVCAVWEDLSSPNKGGKSYIWDGVTEKWVDWKPSQQGMPF